MLEPYEAPPVSTAATGEPRRLGIEVELAGLDVDTLASIVARCLDGTVCNRSAASADVAGTRFGDFRVELDARSLQERTYLEPLADLGIQNETLVEKIEDTVVAIASEVVPVEVVAPPVPLTALAELDPLWAEIRSAGGLGTGASALYAFGLHLNPELPAPGDAETIRRHLQAYFLLEDWIADREAVNWTRRVVPFIDPFPEEYRRKVLQPDYAPDLDGLIDDYLTFSPTRNRVLDLLPLFTELRPDCLHGREVAGAELVNPRPTFHYRLPNCEIERNDWSPAASWNRWLRVEQLAQDIPRLQQMATAYGQLADLPWRLQRHGWIRRVHDEWL